MILPLEHLNSVPPQGRDALGDNGTHRVVPAIRAAQSDDQRRPRTAL